MAEHKVSYVDLPELGETFADSFHTLNFDGQTLRMVFCVTRQDDPDPSRPLSSKRYPVLRLVMPAAAGLQFIESLKQMVEQMVKQGVIQPVVQPALAPGASGKPN
jgi:hypothetical protein